jgi:hypothetical protein
LPACRLLPLPAWRLLPLHDSLLPLPAWWLLPLHVWRLHARLLPAWRLLRLLRLCRWRLLSVELLGQLRVMQLISGRL